jgi:hypothetical protein
LNTAKAKVQKGAADGPGPLPELGEGQFPVTLNQSRFFGIEFQVAAQHVLQGADGIHGASSQV